MEPEQLLAQLVKALGRRIDQLSLSVTSGGVDNMETYKYIIGQINACLLYTSPSPRDRTRSRMPSSA